MYSMYDTIIAVAIVFEGTQPRTCQALHGLYPKNICIYVACPY